MLGQGCLRALFGKQFPPTLKGVKSGCHEVGPKVGTKVGFDPFSLTLDPVRHIDKIKQFPPPLGLKMGFCQWVQSG